MKKILLTAMILSLPSFALSQALPAYRVSGTVTDSLSAPIVGVVVQLLVSDDSPPVSATITGRNGEFILQNVPAGEFTLTASHLTYQSITIPCRVTGDMELPAMVLAENVQMIGAVTVSPDNLTQSADRYTVALRNDPVTGGKTVSEVLDFLPAVSNREGDLRILGQAVSRVRINGVLIEDRKELAAIQADNIDNVEVVYMSGVSDMAPGAGGEINIRLKRTKDGGFYGSVAANTTMNFKYGNTLNGVNSSFNYGYKKWSIYNYVGYNYNNQFSDLSYLTRYLKTGQNNDQNDQTRGWNNYISDRLSITYDIDPKHMLGANLRYSRSKNAPNFHSLSRFTNETGIELDRSRSEYNASVLNNQYQASLHYRWRFDSKGSEFNLRGDYLNYQTDNNREYRNTYLLGLTDESTEYMNSVLDNNVEMYYVDAKFTTPAGEKGKLEAGLNYNANRTHQLLGYTDLAGGSWVTNENLSDDYRLSGNNYAAFASFSSTMGERFTYSVGLRGERREMSYNSIELGLRNEKNYNVLGAQANLMYALNPQKGRMLVLAYTRGANNMPYSAITPVVTYLDEYTYSRGNVGLKPTAYDMAILNFMLNKNWTFRLLGAFVNNTQYTGVFTDPDDPRVTYTMPVNAGRGIGGSIYAEYKFKPVKWWSVSADVLWELMETETPDGDFTDKKWLFNVNNNFAWGKGWGGTLNLYYEPAYQANVNRKLMTELAFTGSVSKTLSNNKWRINLQGSLFNISRDNIMHTPDIWRKFYNDRHRYRLTLSLTYNFNSGKRVSVKQTSSQQSYNETLNTSKE